MKDVLKPYEHRIGLTELIFIIGITFIPPLFFSIVIFCFAWGYIALYMSKAWFMLIFAIVIGGFSFIKWIAYFAISLEMFSLIPSIIKMIKNFIDYKGLQFRIDESGITYFDDNNNKIAKSWSEVEDVGIYRQGRKVEWEYQIKFTDGKVYTFSGWEELTTEELKQKIESFWYNSLSE